MANARIWLVLGLLLLASAQSAVIGIDFGSQFYKAVLVQPGSPFKILENTSSQRKTENAMTFTSEERVFEKDAVTQSVSYPETTILQPLNLLGMQFTEENEKKWRNDLLLTNKFIKDERGLMGYQITIPENKDFVNVDVFNEEIIAMIFIHLKELSKRQVTGSTTDVTITVPASFTINQRVMMKDAAELAGFNVLSLINENTAAALMYGIDTKGIEYPSKILFVNMGATNLDLSLVKLDQVVDDAKGKNITSIHILEEASLSEVGGYLFDVELSKLLAERFDSLPERQGKESVLANPKIVKRLIREATKLKEILSANKNVPVKMLDVADNLNLEFMLTREDFESRIKPMVEKIRPAFEKIFKSFPVDNINEVEILGGGLRVPLVKDFISELLGGKTLSTHMNPDEAMAFGSAYIGANFSSSYQVQKVYMYSSIPYSVYLNITQTGGWKTENTEECFTKHLKLYDKSKDNLGSIKTLSIDNHVENMNAVLYKINDDGSEQVLVNSRIRGIDELKSSPLFKKEGMSHKISLTFKFDKDGILKVRKAEAIMTEKVKDKKKKAKDTDDSDDDDENVKYKTVTHPFSLKAIDKLEGPQPMNSAQKSKARKRIIDLEKQDKEHEKRKKARNEYENALYSTRSFLDDEETVKYLKSPDDKTKLLLLIDEEERWLYGEGANAQTDALKNRIKVIEKKISPIQKRKEARQKIPDSLSQAKKSLSENEDAFNKYIKSKDWLEESELDKHRALLKEKKDSLEKKETDFTNYALNAKLPFTDKDIQDDVKAVADNLKALKKIKKPKPPQKEVKSKGDLVKEQTEEELKAKKPIITDATDNVKFENVNVENIKSEKLNVESIDVTDENMGLKPGSKIPENLREQAQKLLKKQKLKNDIVSGKVDPEKLSAEELADIMS